MNLSPIWRRIYGDQDDIDALEDREILVYRIWKGWEAEHALQQTERQLRREAVRTGEASPGASPSRFARAFLWAMAGATVVALVIAGWNLRG